MALPKKLKESDIINIMEFTNRFCYLQTRNNKVIFWDNVWEEEHAIIIGNTFESLIQWMVDFFYKDGYSIGKIETQRTIKKSLGIDTL